MIWHLVLCRIRIHFSFAITIVLCIFTYNGYLAHTNSNLKYDKSAFPSIVMFHTYKYIYVSKILQFETQLAFRFVPVGDKTNAEVKECSDSGKHRVRLFACMRLSLWLRRFPKTCPALDVQLTTHLLPINWNRRLFSSSPSSFDFWLLCRGFLFCCAILFTSDTEAPRNISRPCSNRKYYWQRSSPLR